MKCRRRITHFIAAAVTCFLIVGCTRKDVGSENRSSPRATETPAASKSATPPKSLTVNGKTLDAKMSDADILAVFNVDQSKATSKRSQGKDGYSMTYTQGEQNVSIAHSTVTGVYVMAWGPIKGDWPLGQPPAE